MYPLDASLQGIMGIYSFLTVMGKEGYSRVMMSLKDSGPYVAHFGLGFKRSDKRFKNFKMCPMFAHVTKG